MHRGMTQEELAEKNGCIPTNDIKMGNGERLSGNGKSTLIV